MTQIEEKIGYSFRNAALLETALTHSSYANERGCESYERLEFLGDSLLGFVTAEYLFSGNRPLPEGKMTKVRADYVCETALHGVSLKLGLNSFLRLGRGEEMSGGRERVSVLADIVEAVIAAIYLDGGMEPAREFILNKVLSDIDFSAEPGIHDYKSSLQETIQKTPGASVEYRMLSESGPDHCKSFCFGVFLGEEKLGEGSGRTKKEAEQKAAEMALEAISN